MTRSVYPCEEFELVDVPLDTLLTAGRVDVYPEVTGKGFFDIDYRGGRLVLTAKSYVGLIPLNDRVAIHVIPRFPIDNLFYILQKADATLKYIGGYLRKYDVTPPAERDPVAMFGSRMLDMLGHIRREGLLRRYVSSQRNDECQGELLIGETIARYYSQGIRYRQVRRITRHTPDIPENQLIKSALLKLASFYASASDRQGRSFKKDAENLLTHFDQVSNLRLTLEELHYAVPRHVQQLPNIHRQYAALLWMAYLIESRRGVALEKVGPVAFDTFVVNLADVFEDYVRHVLVENIDQLLAGARVKNGNVDEVPLFSQGQPQKVKPDIYVTVHDQAVIVFDAKYKPDVKPSDRYEVLAFCEALQVKTAVILSPSVGGRDVELLGKTRGGVSLHIVRIDLGAKDMATAERKFLDSIRVIITDAANDKIPAIQSL